MATSSAVDPAAVDPAAGSTAGAGWPGGTRRLARLATPVAISVSAGVVVQLAVLTLLGRMGGTAVYVRSLFTPVALLLVALGDAFDVTGQVAAAISRGRGRPGDARRYLRRLTLLGALAFTAAAAALVLLAPPLATLLHAAPAVQAQFVSFLRWTALAHLPTVVPTLFAATLRGWGRPAVALSVTATVALTQVGGVWLLGSCLQLGVLGVPWATAASALAGTALGWYLLGRYGPARGPAGGPDPMPAPARLLGEVGAPIAASWLLLFGVQFALISALAGAGAAVVAGFASGYTIQSVLVVPALAIGTATAIAVNQARGAGHPGTELATVRAGLRLAAAVYLPLAGVLWVARVPVAHLATAAPPIAEQTQRYLTIVGPTLALLGPALAAVVILQQTGAGRLALVLNLPYYATMALLGGALARHTHRPDALYATIAALNLIGLPVVLACLRRHTIRPRPATPRPLEV